MAPGRRAPVVSRTVRGKGVPLGVARAGRGGGARTTRASFATPTPERGSDHDLGEQDGAGQRQREGLGERVRDAAAVHAVDPALDRGPLLGPHLVPRLLFHARLLDLRAHWNLTTPGC